ncbi:MAG: hypothetical protein Q8P51_05495 [Ignavibacteria bacterium]|nr:hypothetical protein [Ignavibacteria bacterium]
MPINRFAGVFLLSGVLISPLSSQVFLEGDSVGDAYKSIRAQGYDYEVPDCNHPVRHITEEWDEDPRKVIFAFTLHRDKDDDRCINTDRQRCEIETDAHSPEDMQGSRGETHAYRWKFKLDSGFQPSPNFCHIHQIKADSGAPDSGAPLITITPRYGTPNKLQVIFTAPKGERGSGTLKEVDLEAFLGVWVEACERARYDRRGSYDLVIRRVSDDSVLLSYHNDTLNLWREGSNFNRPKYGIYRSLKSKTYLRDESVRFADFSLAEGEETKLPAMPAGLSVSGASSGLITITWVDNSNNEDQFRIDRSTDGVAWRYHATASGNAGSYIDTRLEAGTVYHYRVRAENTFGNSPYCEPVNAVLQKTNDSRR